MADWRLELGNILEKRARASRAEQENAQFEAFMRDVASPALNDLADELRKHDRNAIVRTAPAAMVLTVSSGETEEISFRVLRRSVPNFVVAYAEVRLRKGQRLVRMDTNIKEGQSPLAETTQDDIIACFLKYYAMVLDSSQQAENNR